MRIRATVAAVTGALALSAFVVPAAQAADAPSGKAAFSAATADGTSTTADTLDVTFSDMKVNNGKSIVVGATNTVSVPVTYSVTHAADLDTSSDNFASGPLLYKGTSVDTATNMLISDDPGTCTAASTTVLSCSGVIDIDATSDLSSSEAGTWHAGGLAVTKNGDGKLQGDLGSIKVLRKAKLTVNASPEPVAKGKTITVTGTLTRANWDTNKYAGYASQSVVLQFRKAGTSTYTNVKGITSTSTGTLKTTTTASVDGYYRFVFAGSATTAPVNATGDYIDVQ